MNFKKLLLSGVLSLGVLANSAAPAFATQLVGGASQGQLDIEVEATNIDVTVPSTIALVFNADGTNTVPDGTFTIENNSITAISLDTIDFEANGTGWQFLSDSQDLKTKSVDTKSIKFKLGLDGDLKTVAPSMGDESDTGTATWLPGEFDIDCGDTKTMKFEVERTAFTSATPNAKAFDMTMNFSFN